MAAKGKPVRIRNLRVNELSVVDKAANGEETLLFKRRGDDVVRINVGMRINDESSETISVASVCPEVAALAKAADDAPDSPVDYDRRSCFEMISAALK